MRDPPPPPSHDDPPTHRWTDAGADGEMNADTVRGLFEGLLALQFGTGAAVEQAQQHLQRIDDVGLIHTVAAWFLDSPDDTHLQVRVEALNVGYRLAFHAIDRRITRPDRGQGQGQRG